VIIRATGATLYDADGGEVATLAPGTRLTATARAADNGWLYVSNNDAGNGWVAEADVLVFNEEVLPTEEIDLQPATPTPAATTAATPAATAVATTTMTTTTDAANAPTQLVGAEVTVNTRSLNVRSGPGTAYAVIGKVTAEETVIANGRNAATDWVQIQLPTDNSKVGWVAVAYLKPSPALGDLPVVAVAAPAPAQAASAPAAAVKTTETITATTKPAPATTAAPVSGLTGKIVFQTAWGGPIYIYNLTTGALKELTTGYDPSISPDGTQVVFTRLGGEHGIYLINVDGSNERRIFSERNAFFSPKFSPDGKSIVVMRTDTSYDCQYCVPEELRAKLPWHSIRPRMAAISPDGTNYRDIPALDTVMSPDWNSAGIVYGSSSGIQLTYEFSKEASKEVHFIIRQQYHQDPDWQPNGGRIAFQQRRAGHWDIYGVNPDGAGLVPLTRPVTVLVDELPSNVSPAWSPDGQHIVFLSNRTPQNSAGEWGIWVMDPDGGNPQRLPIDVPIEYTFVQEQMVDWGP